VGLAALEFHFVRNIFSHLNSAFKIFVCTQTHTWFKLEVNKLFSILLHTIHTHTVN
jgi:hypothetical protein